MKLAPLTLLLLLPLQSTASGGGGTAAPTTAPTASGPSGCYLLEDFDCNDRPLTSYGPCTATSAYFSSVSTEGDVCPSGTASGDFVLCVDFGGGSSVSGSVSIQECLTTGTSTSFAIDLASLASSLGYSNSDVTPVTCGIGGSSTAFDNFINSLCAGSPPPQMIVSICPPGKCPNFRGSGRNLLGRSFEGNEGIFQSVAEDCAKHQYEGFLHVTDHLVLLGIPSEEAQKEGCPFLMAHSVVGDHNDPASTKAKKEVLMWSNKQDFEDHYSVDESLSFGHFVHKDLVDAYHAAEASNAAVGVYDAIGNNCGHFVVQMAKELDVEIDSRTTGYVTRRLVQHAGKELADKIRSSVSFLSFFPNGRALRLANEEEELISVAVENTAATS